MDHIISYQLHSRNDLGEWNALFRKGATSLKVDPHYLADHEHFILSHDAPNATQLEAYHYSTLEDVLTYFESPPLYLKGKSIDVALCFKEAPESKCDPTNVNSTANDWRQKTQDFFARANQLVAHVKRHHDIDLTFVLDGDAKPCGCLQEEFLPWQSVWISTDNCSLECYDSNEGFCERYSIFNDPARSDWTNYSRHHYGKFGGMMDQTLQVWEPDAQVNISNLIDIYNSGRTKGIPSGSGLAFAINVDIAMFQIFTARQLANTKDAQGFNLVVEDSQNASLPILIYDEGTMGEIRLQYQMPQGQPPQQRIVSFVPFERLTVGSSQDVVPPTAEELKPVEADLEETQKIIQHQFGNSSTLIQSTSSLQVDGISFFFVAMEGKVYGAAKSSSNNNASTLTTTGNFSLLGLGTSVHASGFQDKVLLVTEGNYCYNSHLHNTRAAPPVCTPQIDPQQHACPYAIDYTVGLAQNWYQWLNDNDNDKTTNSTILTSCNDYLLHGTMTLGKHPVGALFELPNDTTRVGIMVAHEPYPLEEESGCGTPLLGETGIVLSAFASPVVTDILNAEVMPTADPSSVATMNAPILPVVLVAYGIMFVLFFSAVAIVIGWLWQIWHICRRQAASSSVEYESVQNEAIENDGRTIT